MAQPRFDMFQTGYTNISCGVMQLSDIWRLFHDTTDRDRDRKCFEGIDALIAGGWRDGLWFLFSDSETRGNGAYFAEYLTKHKLGEVIKLGPQCNPNSGNQICLWVWKYNLPKCIEHVNEAKEKYARTKDAKRSSAK